MWPTLHNSNPPLYLTLNEEHSGLEILITDYISLWQVKFTKESFLSKLKECNEDLEFESDDAFVQQGITMLSEPDKIKKLQVERDDGEKTLSICMYTSFGYPFKFECKLEKSSDQFFYEKVTKHLLKVIKDLRSSETKLRETLKKKDKVIKAYKNKGASLTARRLKNDAVEFNDEAHMSGHKEYDTIFGANLDPDTVLSKTELLSEKQTAATIKIEPGTIKTENETQNDHTNPIPISVNIKQEDVKREPLTRKKKKLNL